MDIGTILLYVALACISLIAFIFSFYFLKYFFSGISYLIYDVIRNFFNMPPYSMNSRYAADWIWDDDGTLVRKANMEEVVKQRCLGLGQYNK